MALPDFIALSGCYLYKKKELVDAQAISTNNPRSDVELMEAVSRRESDAIQEIYKRYDSDLRPVIQSVLHEEGETDDTLNDVFLQLWDQAGHDLIVLNDLPLKPTLYRPAINSGENLA